MLPRLLLAAVAASLLAAPVAHAEMLFGSWADLRSVAGVDRAKALVPGPDGRLWYVAPGFSSVGAVDADGAATAHALEGLLSGSRSFGLGGAAILPNADGTVWVLDGRGRLGLWRVADGKLLRRMALLRDPEDDGASAWRTPDGSIWSYQEEELVQLTPAGAIERHHPFGKDGDIDVAAVGDDGRMWLYGTRKALSNLFAKVDGAGKVEAGRRGEDPYEGFTLTWETEGVVSEGRLWYPAIREFRRDRPEAVLVGVAPGLPVAQVRLGLPGDDESFEGGVDIGPGPGGSIAFADRLSGSVGVVAAGVTRVYAKLPAAGAPADPVADATGTIRTSLDGGRIAAVAAGGAARTFTDAIVRDRTPPKASAELLSECLSSLRAGRLRARVSCDQVCGVEVHLAVDRATARRLGVRGSDSIHFTPLRRGLVSVAMGTQVAGFSGTRDLRFRLDRKVRRRLAGVRSLRAHLVVNAFDASLDLARDERRITLRG